MTYRVLQFPEGSEPNFIAFWSRQYNYAKEHLYDENIVEPPNEDRLHKEGRVHKLFLWKNGRTLSKLKLQGVVDHFIGRLSELDDYRDDLDPVYPVEFVEHFDGSGPIWRIFFLHIHRPKKYPIFDQHVFRAMRFLQTGEPAELPLSPKERIRIYHEEYRAFYAGFDAHDKRSVDKALWAFGKFLKLGYKFDDA